MGYNTIEGDRQLANILAGLLYYPKNVSDERSIEKLSEQREGLLAELGFNEINHPGILPQIATVAQAQNLEIVLGRTYQNRKGTQAQIVEIGNKSTYPTLIERPLMMSKKVEVYIDPIILSNSATPRLNEKTASEVIRSFAGILRSNNPVGLINSVNTSFREYCTFMKNIVSSNSIKSNSSEFKILLTNFSFLLIESNRRLSSFQDGNEMGYINQLIAAIQSSVKPFFNH